MLVAEDITSRFLNVISLFNKAIPLIAIQLRALEVGDVLTLNATTVLNLARLGTEEEDEPGQATDRSFWLSRSSPQSMAVVDDVNRLVNEITAGLSLKYNKYYIGLARDGIANNFLVFRPRREHAIVEFRIPRSDEVTALIDDSGADSLDYDTRYGQYRLRLTASDLTTQRELLLELIRRASKTPPSSED